MGLADITQAQAEAKRKKKKKPKSLPSPDTYVQNKPKPPKKSNSAANRAKASKQSYRETKKAQKGTTRARNPRKRASTYGTGRTAEEAAKSKQKADALAWLAKTREPDVLDRAAEGVKWLTEGGIAKAVEDAGVDIPGKEVAQKVTGEIQKRGLDIPLVAVRGGIGRGAPKPKPKTTGVDDALPPKPAPKGEVDDLIDLASKVGKVKPSRSPIPGATGRKATRAARKSQRATYREQQGIGKAQAYGRRHKPSKAGASNRARRAAYNAGTYGGTTAAGGLGATAAAIQVKNQAKAFEKDPKQYLDTNLRVAASLPAAVAGDIKDLTYTPAKKLITGQDDPFSSVRGVAKEELNYYKNLVKIFADQDIETTNPETGAKETLSPSDAILRDYGILPAATAALGVGGVLSRGGRTPRARISEADAQRAIAQQAAEIAARVEADKGRWSPEAERAKSAAEKAAERARKAAKSGRRGRQKERTEESVHAAVSEDRARAMAELEAGAMGKELNTLRRELGDDAPDVVSFLARHGYHEGKAPEAALRAHLERLDDPGVDLPSADTAPSTRHAIHALLNNPEWIGSPELKRVVDAYRDYDRKVSGERHETFDAGDPNVRRPRDERARLLSQAQALGIDDVTQLAHREIGDDTDLTPEDLEFGEKMDQAVSQEVKRDRSKAATARKRAAANERVAKQQKGSTRKATLARAARQTAVADKLEARAARKQEIITRAARSRALDAQALALRSQGDLDGAEELFRQSDELMESVAREDARQLKKWAEEVDAARKERGWAEAAYVRNTAADRTDGTTGPQMFKPDAPTRERHKQGVLERQGRVAESGSQLLDDMVARRIALEGRKRIDGFVDRKARTVEGKRVLTEAEYRDARARGQIAEDEVLFPVQQFKRGVEGDPQMSLRALEDADADGISPAIRAAESAEGKKGVVVKRESLTEYRKQMEPSGKGLKGIRYATRAQSLLLLGTSPTWFEFQMAATPLAMVAHNANPRTYYNAFKEYRRMSPEERADLEATHGGYSAGGVSWVDENGNLKPEHIRNVRRVRNSPAGKIAQRINKITRISDGGPLVAMNRKYEAQLRSLFALAEMDRINRPGPARRFVANTAGANELVSRHVAANKGKSLAEISEWYRKNPREAEKLANTTNEALGNWSAMTSVERSLGSVVAFYPFIRFSVRWTFKHFPKNHPIKAAIALNAAQSNAQELERLWGGRPEFLGDWGTILSHSGEDGKAEAGLNLARIAPGSNAIIEAMGGGRGALQSATSPLSPAIGIILSALAGQDPYSGRSIEDETGNAPNTEERVINALRGLGQLAGPVRIATKGEPSDTSKMFSDIKGDDRSVWEKLLYPDLVRSPGAERSALELSELFDIVNQRPTEKAKASAAGDPDEIRRLRALEDAADKASKQLDAFYQHYGYRNPRSKGDREQSRKVGTAFRRVTGEGIHPAQRKSADRIKRERRASRPPKPPPTNAFGTGSSKPFSLGKGGGGVDFGNSDSKPFSLGK